MPSVSSIISFGLCVAVMAQHAQAQAQVTSQVIHQRDAVAGRAVLEAASHTPGPTTSTAARATLAAAPTAPVEEVPGQEVLVVVPQKTPWSVSTTSALSWESNPGFSRLAPTESVVFSQSATLRWSETFREEWLADLSVQAMAFRYDALEGFDFDRTAATATVSWLGLADVETAWLQHWAPAVGVEWFRLNEAAHWSEPLLENTSVVVSLSRFWQPAIQQQLGIVFSSSLSVDASVPMSQRCEHSVTGAWIARWAPRWQTTLFCRAALYDYEAHDDWNLAAGASLEYSPVKWLRASLSATGTKNISDVAGFGYENISLGLSLNLRASF
jgi:hypothetical protein